MPNQTKTPGISTRNSSNAAKSGLAHSTNASQATDQANLDANSSKSGDVDNASLAVDIAKMYALLKETSEKQEERLYIIQRATVAVENKLADISARISNAEFRLDFLEDANKAMEADPPATKSEVERLRQKIDDLENRSRRNNLRFVGFPEGCEGQNAPTFLRETIPQLMHLDYPNGIEIDRAHRSLTKRRPDGDHTPRAILARFLRFQDRERIAVAARKMGRVSRNGHHIMVFPDYSRPVVEMRSKFNQCKQMLHERRVTFSLMYPATLVIKATAGRREFDDSKKAVGFIRSLPAASSSPYVIQLTPVRLRYCMSAQSFFFPQ